MAEGERPQAKINHYETFMQRIIVLGLMANRIAEFFPEEYKNMKDVARLADEVLVPFRKMSLFKRWVFNKLFSK